MARATSVPTGVAEHFYEALSESSQSRNLRMWTQELSSIPGHREEAQPGNYLMALEDLEHFPLSLPVLTSSGAPLIISPHSERRIHGRP